MPRRFSAVAAVTAVLLVLALAVVACGQRPPQDQAATPQEPAADEPRFGGRLRIAMSVDVVGLDPHVALAWQSHEVLRHVFEGLLTVDEGFGITPGLAREWSLSDDGKTYTFHLQEGVKFHNGREMTAEDVKYSLERFLNGPRGAELAIIDKVEVTGPLTVDVTLKNPSGTFLIGLASPYTVAVVPKEEVDAQGGQLTKPVGTGPYQFVEWVPDSQVVLRRFDGYWGGGDGPPSGTGGKKVAYLDELVFVPITEEAAVVAALEAGDIDIAFIPIREAERLEALPGITSASTGPSYEFWNFWFGLKTGPMTDKHLRKAFAYAIDRQEMLEATNGGFGVVGNSPINPQSAWYSDVHAQGPTQDLDKAREHLAQSSYNGETVRILTTKGYVAMDKSAVLAQAALEAIGVKAEVVYLEWGALIDAFKSGDYHLISYGYGTFIDPDPMYYNRLHSSTTWSGFNNPEYDRLVEQARNSSDFSERKRLYEEAQKILMEELPLLVTFHEEYYYGMRENVRGFVPWPAVFTRYWNVWLAGGR